MTTPTSFADIGIQSPFDVTLARLDITAPTAVQIEAIPVLLQGCDLIASAPTGTGKTAAFLLPALHRVAGSPGRPGRGPRVLVLAPTRELAQQVARSAQALSRGLPRFSTVCVTGGESYFAQNRRLAAPHEVLVATPGRLIDQLGQGRVDLSRVEVLVLDEADRMLDMGFADDVLAIADALAQDRQTVCFSATLSRAVRDLASRLLREPHWLDVAGQPADNGEEAIDQHVLYVDGPEHRGQLLQACLSDTGLGQAIVFTATKRHAEELAGELLDAGISADALHGDLNQRERTRALNRLRRGECKVLVATDVAARGIDVASVTHVINYNLPKFAEDYVHRIGRTGRAGASGQALSFVGREDVFTLRRIEHFLGRRVQVSEIEGLAASFRPLERRPSDGKGGAFRKGTGHKPAFRGGPAGARHGDQRAGQRSEGGVQRSAPRGAQHAQPRGAQRGWPARDRFEQRGRKAA
jgi:superfamily II DNA/RNA helicase